MNHISLSIGLLINLIKEEHPQFLNFLGFDLIFYEEDSLQIPSQVNYSRIWTMYLGMKNIAHSCFFIVSEILF